MGDYTVETLRKANSQMLKSISEQMQNPRQESSFFFFSFWVLLIDNAKASKRFCLKTSSSWDRTLYQISMGFPGSSVLKNLPANAGDSSSIPKSSRSPVVGNSNPLQYSCLGHPTDRRVWRAPGHGMAKLSEATSWLNKNHCRSL